MNKTNFKNLEMKKRVQFFAIYLKVYTSLTIIQGRVKVGLQLYVKHSVYSGIIIY